MVVSIVQFDKNRVFVDGHFIFIKGTTGQNIVDIRLHLRKASRHRCLVDGEMNSIIQFGERRSARIDDDDFPRLFTKTVLGNSLRFLINKLKIGYTVDKELDVGPVAPAVQLDRFDTFQLFKRVFYGRGDVPSVNEPLRAKTYDYNKGAGDQNDVDFVSPKCHKRYAFPFDFDSTFRVAIIAHGYNKFASKTLARIIVGMSRTKARMTAQGGSSR